MYPTGGQTSVGQTSLAISFHLTDCHIALSVKPHWLSLYITGGHTSLVVTPHDQLFTSLADICHRSHCTLLAVILHYRSYLTVGQASLAVIVHCYLTGGNTPRAVMHLLSGGYTQLAVIVCTPLAVIPFWQSYLTGGHTFLATYHERLYEVC
jgi:hypothetical protein